MDFKSICEGITFNSVQPDKSAYWLEVLNCRSNVHVKEEFYKLLEMPRMSTYAIGVLINKAVEQMPIDQTFVNVGVWHGFTLLAGMFNNPDKLCVGIDNFSEFGGPRQEFRQRFMAAKSEKHSFYDMDYKDYFSGFHKGDIGFYIYDGSHDYQNQMQGLKLAEPFFADGCLIMVDDINWPDPYIATMDFIKQSLFNYDVVFEKKTAGNGHPTFWNGVLFFRKGKAK